MDFQKFALGVLAIAALAAIFADSLATSVTSGRDGRAEAAASADGNDEAPASLEPPKTREMMRREAEQQATESDDGGEDEGEFGDPLSDGEPEFAEDQSLWDSDTEPAVSLDEPDLNLDSGPEAVDADVEVQLPRQRKILG